MQEKSMCCWEISIKSTVISVPFFFCFLVFFTVDHILCTCSNQLSHELFFYSNVRGLDPLNT